MNRSRQQQYYGRYYGNRQNECYDSRYQNPVYPTDQVEMGMEIECECECDCTVRNVDEMHQEYSDGMSGFPLGMAYVPWQQFVNLYDSTTGFDRGTIFKDLDLDFYGRRCN